MADFRRIIKKRLTVMGNCWDNKFETNRLVTTSKLPNVSRNSQLIFFKV